MTAPAQRLRDAAREMREALRELAGDLGLAKFWGTIARRLPGGGA